MNWVCQKQGCHSVNDVALLKCPHCDSPSPAFEQAVEKRKSDLAAAKAAEAAAKQAEEINQRAMEEAEAAAQKKLEEEEAAKAQA